MGEVAGFETIKEHLTILRDPFHIENWTKRMVMNLHFLQTQEISCATRDQVN